MSLFYNNYQRLVQENNDAIVQLSGESFKTLQRMFEYLNLYDASLFELEVIKKDLIGVAQEAEMEGADFKDKLGMPEREFCDSLVREGMEHVRWERMILAVRNGMLMFFGFYIFYWLMIDGATADYGIPTSAIFIGIWCAAWDYMIKYRIRGLGTYRLTDRGKRWLSFGGRMSLMMVYITVLNHMSLKRLFLVRGNGVVLLLVLFLIVAAVFFGNNCYWDKRSEKYNWR